jgi:hypothetical protein
MVFVLGDLFSQSFRGSRYLLGIHGHTGQFGQQFATFLEADHGTRVPTMRVRAGAGGNVGALLAGFLFKSERLSSANAFFYLGLSVAVSAFFVLLLRFRGAEAPSLTFAGAATIGARSAD